MGKKTTVQSSAVAPQQQLVAAPADTAALQSISKSLTNIIQLLSQQNNQTRRESEENRKNQERSKRKGIELGLENSFNAVKSVAQSVVAPVQNILGQIIQFFVTLFLGRALIQLLNWFADPNNQNKIRSIMRFLSDWWPSLVAGYILFGTGFGRIVRKVAGVAVGAVARLAVIAARLTKAIATGKGLKGAAAAFSGGGRLGGWKGGLLRLGIGAAATIGTGMAIDKFVGGGGESPQLDVPNVPSVPALGAFGGGLANLKDLFSNSTSGLTSKFNPFTSFFGSGGLASVMQGLGGVVSGPKGIDKVPAMLTDGEFVMSRGAVQKFGVNALEAMNAAGGGTNQPKIVRGVPHAAGGGLIGTEGTQKDLRREGKESTYGGPYRTSTSLYQRLDRIEKQMQAQKALASGKGVDLKGATFGTDVGKGFGATYQGRKSIVVKGGANKPGGIENEINLGGIRYFAQYKGNDVIYTSNYKSGLSGQINQSGARNKSYQGVGAGLVGGYGLKRDEKNLPPTRVMSGPDGKPFVAYLSYKDNKPFYARGEERDKGVLEKMSDFFNPAGAKGREESLNARSLRMASISDLQQYRKEGMTEDNIKKMMGSRYNQAVNDLKAKIGGITDKSIKDKKRAGMNAKVQTANQEFMNRGGLLGGVGRGLTRMFGTYKDIDKVNAADKASEARIKQAEAAAMGKYYSSSDGKYYGSYAEAEKARQARLGKTSPSKKAITPTPKPAPKVVTKPKVAGGGMGGKRGSGASPSIPKFSASGKSSRKEKNIYGIK